MSSANTPSVSILIIDDSKPLRETTADILTSLGYTIFQAPSGEDGLKIFTERKIDLVILDVNLPHMDGCQIYRELLLINPKVNVIVYSTESQTAVRQRFSPLAIPYFLHKPVEMALLYETVEIALRGASLAAYG